MKPWMETAAIMAVAFFVSLILVAEGAPFWSALLATIAIFVAADYYQHRAQGGHDDD